MAHPASTEGLGAVWARTRAASAGYDRLGRRVIAFIYALLRSRPQQRGSKPQAAAPSDRPVDRAAPRNAGDVAPDKILQRRPPRDERELQRFLDHGEASARQVDRLAIDAFHTFALHVL